VWQQIAANAIVSGSGYLLIALGFALIFRVCRFFHFAHGAVFTAGAYLCFVLHSTLGAPLLTAVIVAFALSAGLGCLIEISVYRPLRRRRSSPLILLVSSLGVYVVIQNLVSVTFGDVTRSLQPGTVQQGILILGARITSVQIVIIASSLLLAWAVNLALMHTKLGTAARAVADDPQLASAAGIYSDSVVLLSLALGSALAGLAGVLVALDVDMTPTMGLQALLMAVVVVVISGFHSVLGLALGAILVGVAQHLGGWYAGYEWQDGIAFLILLVFLLFRPYGILGRMLHKVEI